MLSRDWKQHKTTYDFVIIGSGYGGSILAARLATADLNPKPSICLLERGKEWEPGTFPDTTLGWVSHLRNDLDPLGLYEVLTYPDIAVIKGSGLGGTSLINANVAIVPDKEVFEQDGWPRQVNLDELRPYYDLARKTLAANPHPRAASLPKVQALQRRAQQLGLSAQALDIVVTFADRTNDQGVFQKACTDCGDCVTGCNVGSKNTLYMNYLPLAAKNGAEIYTQTEVDTIQKDGDGWKVNGRYQKGKGKTEKFTIQARNVVLAAGSINSTEILLRSADKNKLAISPAAGSNFGGNGDFFGLSYNGDTHTRVLGFGTHPPNDELKNNGPGPTIVAAIRYNNGEQVLKRFTVEDLSFASAFINAAQVTFALVPNKEDMDFGDELQELKRVALDTSQLSPYSPDGALNHTMLYLCMGFDDQRGYFRMNGDRAQVMWPGSGSQPVFGVINEELRRHARREGSHFLPNPLWEFMRLPLRRLITAHPMGGCTMGEDYIAGAVDQYGRVFAGDGSVHNGLYVADGAVVPTALGVNPFLTISAIAERVAAHKIRDMKGDHYAEAPKKVSFAKLTAQEAIEMSEVQLERVFERVETLPISVMENKGGRQLDLATRTVRNDEYWKGFFPKGHILNQMSAALFTCFKKEFFRTGVGGKNFGGTTSDTDGVIRAANTLEEIDTAKMKDTGDLNPGKYVLLRYTEPQWSAFYDIFKVVNDDLLIGRVYLGPFPNGRRLFTFPMSRKYGFNQITTADHHQLWAQGAAPSKKDLEGVWRMDTISNANHATGVAYLAFENKPDGRFEARYQLMGLIEGLVLPTFVREHFQLNDFTVFHDEIRKLDDDLLIGKWVTEVPAGLEALPVDLGILHREDQAGPGGHAKFGFYYLLARTEAGKLPTTTLLQPLLDQDLPKGVGLTFTEEMVGRFYPGKGVPSADRKGELTIAGRGDAGAVDNSFQLQMNVADINDFVNSADHEARLRGTVKFGEFLGAKNVTYTVDSRRSYFNYLRVNTETREAEMRYYLEFTEPGGRRFSLEGTKYMQKDENGVREVLSDYTTLYTHVHEHSDNGKKELGTGLLKFRTFEDLAAVGNFAGFLASFRVTGTDDARLQLLARLRFLAFTGQFVQREYDPLALPTVTAAGAGGSGG